MITGSNLFGHAVTYRSRFTQFSKLIYATVVSKILLQSLLFGRIVNFDVIFVFGRIVNFDVIFVFRSRSIFQGLIWQSFVGGF